MIESGSVFDNPQSSFYFFIFSGSFYLEFSTFLLLVRSYFWLFLSIVSELVQQ